MEFKVGDRVKVVDVDNEITDRKYLGKTGEIVSIDGRTFPYRVDFGGKNHIFSAKCLQKMEIERELKVGDRVKWTYSGYSGTGVIVDDDGSGVIRWYVKRDITGGPLSDYLFLATSNLALVDSIITEYHGFNVGDVVAVRGSGFTGKITEFSNANRLGGITVVVANDRGERRGITTTDIEKALSHKPEEKQRLQVGDKVKVVSDCSSDYFVGMMGTLIRDDKSDVPFLVELPNGRERWFIERNLERVEDVKPESTRLKIGDRVRVVKDAYDDSYVGKTGVIVTDDQSSVPFVVRFDGAPDSFDQNGKRWFYADELVKIEDVKPVENKIKVGDTVRVVDTDITYDAEFVGKTGMVTEINNDGFMYPVKVQFEGYGPRRFTAKCLEKVAEKTQEEKKQEEPKFEIGDKVKVVNCTSANYGKIGTIIKDDGSNIPFFVKFDGNITNWYKVTSIEKVEDANPVDDWRARFEAFKASHPVGTKVKIARKVETDKHAMPWVPSMDGYIGETLQVVSCGYNKEGDRYTLSVGKFSGPYWNYPMDALEDVTEETNQYTFTVKPSDVDLDRIWREANADFAVVVDTDNKFHSVWVLYRSMGWFKCMSVQRETANDIIKRLKAEYENEKKQRVTVTIY